MDPSTALPRKTLTIPSGINWAFGNVVLTHWKPGSRLRCMETNRTGIHEVRDALGSSAAIGRVLKMTRQGANKLVNRGYVITPQHREYILRLRQACPHVSVAALCGIDE